ncbi:GATA zinc finger domain containing protein [Acanthamoeba castellanii str. Neff]|uniref:GATA zinc finger domain containing protein n=1 Tax=Acanthamoeba castellanii (strain ATCC 30010 / Neff) TaxID=1257118 RepID=L8GXT1_ACACF|nr:GATA zinc finger domain containing protein [Acanthamoeba castellanii str. Neff]ELR17752.1 GATA zinc finger domain containing protein [Acanthamoeba castellanii str. Neff]
MQTFVQLPPLNFPPLTPFLGLAASTTATSFVSPPSPFVWSPTTSPARAPTSQVHNNHHNHRQVPQHHLLHQSPSLSSPAGSPRLNEPTSTPRPTTHARSLPPLRPLLWSGSAGAAHGLFSFPVQPMPALPGWGTTRSLPASPTSTPPQSPTSEERRLRLGTKRKRAMSVPPTGEQRALLQARPGQGEMVAKSEVTFPQGTQVAKWKLNGPRYKRCKVTDANGDDQWKRCQHCGTDSTPEWRNGPLGKGTLCNACGLRYRSKQREQTSRGQSGNVPVSLLLNPESNKKGRANISNPMIWETKLSSSPAQPGIPQRLQHPV